MNVKPSVLPAVEVIAPGGSYNPDFFSHQVMSGSTMTTKTKICIELNLEALQPCLSSHPNDAPLLWTQALLKEAHEVEVKKQKEEEKIEKQLAVNKEDAATEVLIVSPANSSGRRLQQCVCCCFTLVFVWQETTLREQVEGLVEEEEEEEATTVEDGEDVAVGAITLSEKKTERQRKREKAEKIKVSWGSSPLH